VLVTYPNARFATYSIHTKLTINLVNLGVVPRQNIAIPSSLSILEAQWKELRYSAVALSDCMRVLMLSSGMVVSVERRYECLYEIC
jgi:hypothetical protein